MFQDPFPSLVTREQAVIHEFTTVCKFYLFISLIYFFPFLLPFSLSSCECHRKHYSVFDQADPLAVPVINFSAIPNFAVTFPL